MINNPRHDKHLMSRWATAWHVWRTGSLKGPSFVATDEPWDNFCGQPVAYFETRSYIEPFSGTLIMSSEIYFPKSLLTYCFKYFIDSGKDVRLCLFFSTTREGWLSSTSKTGWWSSCTLLECGQWGLDIRKIMLFVFNGSWQGSILPEDHSIPILFVVNIFRPVWFLVIVN